MAQFCDLGSRLLLPVCFTGIFLQGIHYAWNKKVIWLHEHFRDDGSVLHDSLRKTYAGNYWSHSRRNCSWNVEFEKSFCDSGNSHSLFGCDNDGFVCVVEEVGVVSSSAVENQTHMFSCISTALDVTENAIFTQTKSK